MSVNQTRRQTLVQLSAAATALCASSPFRNVYAQTAKPIRIGYLHTPSCDSQMWLMKELNTFAKEGLAPTFTRFNTGIDGFSALVGGSIDVFSTGGVTHNFPARGRRRHPICGLGPLGFVGQHLGDHCLEMGGTAPGTARCATKHCGLLAGFPV